MRKYLWRLLVIAAVAAWTPAAGGDARGNAPASDIAPLVAGIVVGGQVIAGGVALSSGGWGTDYITVSHALSVGVRYSVVREGLPYAQTVPVAACSAQYHGIDVLILRAAAHPRTPISAWGNPEDLRPGEPLLVLPRKEIHPEPSTVKFVHLNLVEWTKAKPADWSPPWRNVMVAEGFSKPGFSGSPWVRGDKVFGLHKGRVKPPGQSHEYPVAETATRVTACLNVLGYESLVPKE